MAQKIQVRRDTVEAWADENPILALGEWGVSYTEDSIVAIKIGNGNDDWGSLDTVYPHVGTTADLVSVDYEPENYTLSGGDGSNSVANHLAGIDNAIGEQFLGSSEPFLIDGEPLDSESGFWGPLFDLFGATTGTWDNPEFPDGNSISLATPSVEQQTLGYTAKWKLNLSPLNRGQGLKGLHFSGAGVEGGGDCVWLVTDASDVAVAGGEWNQGRKVDPGSGFGYPGKAIVPGGGDGSLTDMYFDNVIYPEEGELFYLQLSMSHTHSPYEGVMSVDLIVTPIWEDANASYNPGQPSLWEEIDDTPATHTEALDMLVGEIGPIKHDIEDLIGAPERVDVTESIVGRTTKKVFIDASASNPDPFIVYLPKLEDVTDGHEIEFFRVDDTANVLQITPDGTTDDRFSLNDIATIPFVQVAPMVGRVRLVADTINGWWWPEASFDPTD